MLSKKHAVTEKFDEDENEEEEEEVKEERKEEDDEGDTALEPEKKKKVETFDEPSDEDEDEDDEVTYHRDALANITPNRISMTTSSKLLHHPHDTGRTWFSFSAKKVSSTTSKRKSPISEHSDSVIRKRVKNVGFVSVKEHTKVVEQLAVAHEQNQVYQSTWMRKYWFNYFSIRPFISMHML